MKNYLIKLNQPVLIRDSECGEPILCPVYGFLAPFNDHDEELNRYYQEINYCYVGYLAALHEWSAGREASFSVVENKHWKDGEGHIHTTHDSWVNEICERNRKKLGLGYSVYVIDRYGAQGVCPGCGRDGSIITCEKVMDKLVEISEQQPKRTTEPHTIILFNRPIWLLAQNIWEDQPGFCQIYGVIENGKLDETVKQNVKSYLGYLAMCEEYCLSGITPSGFSTQDGITWFKDGNEYSVTDEAVIEECRICRRKHNLKILAIEKESPEYDIREGVRDGLIVEQDLYEYLWADVKSQQADVRICPWRIISRTA